MSEQERTPWPFASWKSEPSIFSKDRSFNGVNKAKSDVARALKEAGTVPPPMLSDPKENIKQITVYTRALVSGGASKTKS